MPDDWMPPSPHLSPDQFDDFSLPPEKESYYSGFGAGDEHRSRMAGMSVAERNEYMRGLREALNPNGPRRGDLDNPLKKDLPKEPAAPKPWYHQDNMRKLQRNINNGIRLYKKASGKKRR